MSKGLYCCSKPGQYSTDLAGAHLLLCFPATRSELLSLHFFLALLCTKPLNLTFWGTCFILITSVLLRLHQNNHQHLFDIKYTRATVESKHTWFNYCIGGMWQSCKVFVSYSDTSDYLNATSEALFQHVNITLTTQDFLPQ